VPDTDPLVVLSTFKDSAAAATVAQALVGEGLAACVNIVPQVRSIYRWEDAMQDESEALAIIKTTRDRYDRLAQRLVELHSYDVPEVIALPITDGHAPYLAWLASK
jgi:periplasmic divalent cation tolerance protein